MVNLANAETGKQCKECSRYRGTTKCDKCNYYVCRECATFITNPNQPDITIVHNICDRRRKK